MDEELLSRQQPQSLEAEQAVLGSILIDSRCITDVVGIVRPEDFYLQQNREIFEAIYTMFNFSQTIDPVTVLDKLKELGYYHDNSRDYILQLMEITPTGPCSPICQYRPGKGHAPGTGSGGLRYHRNGV